MQASWATRSQMEHHHPTPDPGRVRGSPMAETKQLPWYRAGFLGALVLCACAFVEFLGSIPRLFTEEWTWEELLLFPLQMIAIGFACGAVVGLMLPASRRFGIWGDAVIGALAGPTYLFLCIAMFEPTAFQPKYLLWGVFLALMSAVIGASLSMSVGLEMREQPPKQEMAEDE